MLHKIFKNLKQLTVDDLIMGIVILTLVFAMLGMLSCSPSELQEVNNNPGRQVHVAPSDGATEQLVSGSSNEERITSPVQSDNYLFTFTEKTTTKKIHVFSQYKIGDVYYQDIGTFVFTLESSGLEYQEYPGEENVGEIPFLTKFKFKTGWERTGDLSKPSAIWVATLVLDETPFYLKEEITTDPFEISILIENNEIVKIKFNDKLYLK